ncbi:dihydroxy-acid dehydratase [Arthrobacter methylotrophus]|uniref:dihydroxy-acid dehydratase domain-containing protein n=1 Tax=Arthrobacter methylotrophus TaxID=121291 RepID=UPI003CD0602B
MPAAACTRPHHGVHRRSARHVPAGSAAPPSADRRRDDFARRSGEAVVNLLRLGITARDIMTKKAFENAIAVTMAFGGSHQRGPAPARDRFVVERDLTTRASQPPPHPAR